ncbi:MAG TPA: EamA family transporter [Planctomycetaceae bacterium]|nr:EamA family transporter [Planctomycetaceae bacterium]
MHWFALSLLSAVFLGFYEIAKKVSVRDNAVPPVLFFNVLTSALIWLPLIFWSRAATNGILWETFKVEAISWTTHGLLALKAVIAGSSWIFASFALKHLPISIAAPIRASSPLWTILIATLFMHERPAPTQWLGVAIILISFWAFSLAGRKEGIHFHTDRWVGFMLIATLLGSVSALYDKYLLQQANLRPSTVQAWFSIYLVAFMMPLFTHWCLRRRKLEPFQWRWAVPTIAVLLLVSDFLYFTAIADKQAMISLISPLRRTSVIIAFVAGVLMYNEKNWRFKAICIGALLTGVYVLSFN